MAVRKKSWDDTGFSYQTIGREFHLCAKASNTKVSMQGYPHIRGTALSLNEVCGLCKRVFADTTQVAHIHLSGQAYDFDTLVMPHRFRHALTKPGSPGT